MARSFSWINATSKTNDEAYFQLNAAGVKMYRALAQQWGAGKVGVHETGMVEWANAADEIQLQTMRSAAKKLVAWGYATHSLDRKELERLEPNISFNQGAEGYLFPQDSWLDVPRYLQFLTEHAQDAGARIEEHCRVLELLADDEGRVLGVLTEGGRIHCDSVVVATGADTPEVLSLLTGYEGFATRFPAQVAPGFLLTAPAVESTCIQHVVYPPDSGGLHMRPAGDGKLLLGADDTDGMIVNVQSKEILAKATNILLQRAQRFIPKFEGVALAERCRSKIGIRVVPVDNRSIAGPMLSAQGLYINLTHSGITLAPVLAKLIADSIELSDIPDQLRPFNIDRFSS